MRLSDSLALVGSGDARISHSIDCNVYAVDAPQGPVLIDTGCGLDTNRIIENTVTAFGDEPADVLLTHCHSDHSQGGPDLQQRSVSVYAPDASLSFLEDGSREELGLDRAIRDGVYPEDYEFTHFSPDQTVTDGSSVSLAGQLFTAVRVRGHAVDHTCYLTDLDGKTVCFSGDAVFADGSLSLLNIPTSSLDHYRSDFDTLAGRNIGALLPGHDLPRLNDGQECIEQAIAALEGLAMPPSRT
jgi:glyoxylase-like metal-dependent hydrolase (beta-lactamase superfamily II)